MKHVHHVIPRHAGGTDDPSNLVELSIQDHAEAHKWLFIQHGHWQDAIAWLSLSGQMIQEDRMLEFARMGGKAGGPKLKGIPKTEEHKRSLRGSRKPYGPISDSHRQNMRKPKSLEHREKIRLAKLGNKNPMYGKGPNSGSIKQGEHRSLATEFKRKS